MNQEDSFEVINLVLDDASREVVDVLFVLLPVFILPRQAKASLACDVYSDVRERKAAFF